MIKKIRLFLHFVAVSVCLMSIASCSENEAIWNPYYNWHARNTAWFETIADSARTAISEAKHRYGNDWEKHCDWRMFQTFTKSADAPQGVLSDSVCVRIVGRGQGKYSPSYTDSVSVNFRGWIMPTEYLDEYNELKLKQSIFTQTYYGPYNPAVATPQKMAVSNTVEGFCTALQHMVEGDDWMVYIPQELAYGSKASSVIPAYSTLLFRLHAVEVHRWHAVEDKE